MSRRAKTLHEPLVSHTRRAEAIESLHRPDALCVPVGSKCRKRAAETMACKPDNALRSKISHEGYQLIPDFFQSTRKTCVDSAAGSRRLSYHRVRQNIRDDVGDAVRPCDLRA